VVVAVCCSKGGDGEEIELIQADGITAMAIYRQQGGGTETSVLEALDISTAEARRSLAIKWCSPRWLGDGRWQRFLAGREPTSCLFLFLGGDAWRTPAFGGGGTPVLDCFGSIRCRVFFIICKPLSSNTRFVRASVVSGWADLIFFLPRSRSGKVKGELVFCFWFNSGPAPRDITLGSASLHLGRLEPPPL
jgi:hypothetical protein